MLLFQAILLPWGSCKVLYKKSLIHSKTPHILNMVPNLYGTCIDTEQKWVCGLTQYKKKSNSLYCCWFFTCFELLVPPEVANEMPILQPISSHFRTQHFLIILCYLFILFQITSQHQGKATVTSCHQFQTQPQWMCDHLAYSVCTINRPNNHAIGWHATNVD